MKVALIVSALAFALGAARGSFAATDMKSYRIHLNGALNGIQEGTPGKLYWAKKDLGFIIRHQDWDAVHRSVAYYYVGVIDFMENDLHGAIKNFLAAIKLNPEYPEAYFNLGAVYYKQDLLKKAEEAFLKAIELRPEYGRAHYSLGFVYLQQKQYDRARKHAERAAENGVPFKTLKESLAKINK